MSQIFWRRECVPYFTRFTHVKKHWIILNNLCLSGFFVTRMKYPLNYMICDVLFCFGSIFHSFGDVTIAGEELQILIYARHVWPLSSDGSLACHTFCDTGHPFIMVMSENPWHSHLLPSVWQWSCHYLFKRLRSVTIGIWKPNLPLALQLKQCVEMESSSSNYKWIDLHPLQSTDVTLLYVGLLKKCINLYISVWQTGKSLHFSYNHIVCKT